MSTRCNIVVRDSKRQYILYHHHDGYPEGVGIDLWNRFSDKLGNTRYDAINVVNELLKDKEDDDYELTHGLHSDIEYLYEIDLMNERISCKSVTNWDKLEVLDIIDLSEVTGE